MNSNKLPVATEQDGSYPRPQLMRMNWYSLEGEWDFAFGGSATSSYTAEMPDDVTFDLRIKVPFPAESPYSGIGDSRFHPVVWYRRNIYPEEITTAGLSEDRPRIILNFAAVDFQADVWLNNSYLGHHEGGQTPFSFDATDYLVMTSKNSLIVRAIDDPLDVSIPRGKQDWQESPHSIWYHRTTGIWQPVWLECLPKLHIKDVSWNSDLVHASVDLQLILNGKPTEETWVHLRIDDNGTLLAEGRFHVFDSISHLRLELPNQRNGQGYEELLWTPENPKLLSASIQLDGRNNDDVASYLGLRTIKSNKQHLLLNDRPIYLRAILSQNYWPESHLAPPSHTAFREEVEHILNLGFNTARIHQKAEDPRFLFWADKLGLMIWAETASPYEFSDRSIQTLTAEWTHLVRRDRSHPSIIVWVPIPAVMATLR